MSADEVLTLCAGLLSLCLLLLLLLLLLLPLLLLLFVVLLVELPLPPFGVLGFRRRASA